MLPYSISQFGNPHSRTHVYGWEAEEAVEEARKVTPPAIACSELTIETLQQGVKYVQC